MRVGEDGGGGLVGVRAEDGVVLVPDLAEGRGVGGEHVEDEADDVGGRAVAGEDEPFHAADGELFEGGFEVIIVVR